jgi:RNA polymerase sigma-70 factor (ECF subfamily)
MNAEHKPSLLARVRAGDRVAMAEFLVERRGDLLAFIRHNLTDVLQGKIDPEALAQQVHQECVRAVAGIDLRDRDPFEWACRVAERRIIDAHRDFFGSTRPKNGEDWPVDTPDEQRRDAC